MELGDNIQYNDNLERILAKEAEKCLALRWSHDKAERHTSRLNSWFVIPSIILSSLASASSFAGANLLPFKGSEIFIGFISLAVATINTLASYWGFSKKSEAHRISAISYARLHRWLMIELSIPRESRLSAKDLLKIVREEGDRMNEISPQLPEQVIKNFKKEFSKTTTAIPEILNGLDAVQIYKEPSKEPERKVEKIETKPEIKISLLSV